MATYWQKYMAEWQNSRGQSYRLIISQRDYDGGNKKIGYLAGCVLEIQGNMGDVISPVVKTQLRFTIIDAWDKPDTAAYKYGNWQEFFTPDATLYKVELSELNGNTATPIWTGYVTPDSWLEDLGYRGAITVTARDNVGHLKDFPFVADGSITPDDNGLIQVRYIFERAMQVIDFPMTFSWESWGPGQYSPEVIETEDGDYLTDAYVNASLFDGMDWYEVFERTLEAIGFAFRYVGQNKCVACSLRNLPKMGHFTDAGGSQTMEFYGGSLELDPAVKQIKEEADYKLEADIQEDKMAGIEFTGSKRQYTWKYGSTTGSAWDYQISNPGVNGWQSGYGFLRGSDYTLTAKLEQNEGEDAATAWPLLVANQSSPSTYQSFRLPCVSPNVTLHIVFGTPLEGKGLTMQILELGISKTYLARLSLRIMFVAGGVTKYWDGEDWSTTSQVLNYTPADRMSSDYPVDITLGEADHGDGSYLLIEFRDIQFSGSDMPDQGIYARIKSIGTEIAGAVLEKNTVTTINNPAYNVMLDRRPFFSALSRTMGFAQTRNYVAGMFYYPYTGSYPMLFPYKVWFSDYVGGLVPLPVLIHQQILCYYHGAARVLSGNCAPVNKGRFAFDKLCVYKGHTYLLQGGTMDFFSGILSGAVLREFVDFSTLWSGGAPSYSEDVIYNG